MPAFTFTSPEGKQYTVNGPDGSTSDQAFQLLQQQLQAGAASQIQPPDESTSRVLGLGVRAGLKGVGEIADIPKNLATGAFSLADAARAKARSVLGLPAEAAQPNPADSVPSMTGAMDQTSTGLGLPSPATGGERIASAAISGAPTALIAPGSAVQGAMAGAAGGAASQTAAEAGGSQLTQVLAGLAGGAAVPAAAAGTAAAIRGAVRGADGSAMAANASALPGQTVGMASGNQVVQALEANLARIPGGGAIRNAVANLNQKIADQSADIVDNLRGAADAEPATAGDVLTKQLTAASKRIDAARGVPLDAIWEQVPPNTMVDASTYRGALEKMTATNPQGASTDALLVQQKLKAMAAAFDEDVQRNAGPGTPPGKLLGPNGQPLIPGTPAPPPVNQLPIQVLRDWKTRMGGLINWTGFGSSDPINGQLKVVWGALKDDINNGVAAFDPKLGPALRQANSQYAVAQAQLENLHSVVDKAGGPEKVFTGLMSGTKDGSTGLNQVLPQLDPAGRQLLAATQLQRMGMANAGAQGAAGGTFSADTFLTNWNKMHPDARAQLFGQLPNNYSQNVTKLAHDAEILKRFSKVMPNSSNTAAASAGATALTGGILAAVTGHPGGLAAVGGAYGAARLLGAALTSPKTVAWLVKPTSFAGAKTGAVGSGIAAANNAAQQPAPAPSPVPAQPPAAGGLGMPQ